MCMMIDFVTDSLVVIVVVVVFVLFLVIVEVFWISRFAILILTAHVHFIAQLSTSLFQIHQIEFTRWH